MITLHSRPYAFVAMWRCCRGLGNDQGPSRPKSSSPLLLFRKISGESTHTATLPPEAVEHDLTVHLWLICSGVCGMDVADVRQALRDCDWLREAWLLIL